LEFSVIIGIRSEIETAKQGPKTTRISKTKQNRTEQNRTEQNRTEQNRTENKEKNRFNRTGTEQTTKRREH